MFSFFFRILCNQLKPIIFVIVSRRRDGTFLVNEFLMCKRLCMSQFYLCPLSERAIHLILKIFNFNWHLKSKCKCRSHQLWLLCKCWCVCHVVNMKSIHFVHNQHRFVFWYAFHCFVYGCDDHDDNQFGRQTILSSHQFNIQALLRSLKGVFVCCLEYMHR